MDDKRKEAIRQEARKMLDKFGNSLENVPSVREKESNEIFVRHEDQGEGCDEDFRERMFENAPGKKGDCIVAERSNWKV